jgi:hypothetical protein
MISLDDMELPADLLWEDEFDWSGASATRSRTLQGKQVVQATAMASGSGRPITLGNEHAWIDRAELLTLQAWAGEPGKELLLTLHDGRAFKVLFRLWDEPVLSATPVIPLADPRAGARYKLLALKLAVA